MFAKLILLLLALCFVGCQAVATENGPDCTSVVLNFSELVEVPAGSVCHYSDSGTYRPTVTRATWFQQDQRYGCLASNSRGVVWYVGCYKVKPKNPGFIQ